jgi:hypothetical protein
MHEENLHIIPDPKKGFPQPDIPADEAWSKMAELLDTEMPVSPPEPPSPPKPSPSAGGGIFGGSSNIWGIALGVTGVVGLLTWGVISLTNKLETSAIINDTIHAVKNITLTDSSTSTDQNLAFSPGKIDNKDTKKNLPENRPASDVIVQAGAVSPPGNETKNEQEPAPSSTSAAAPRQAAVKLAANEPAQPITRNITTLVKDIPVKQPVNESIIQDTVKSAEFQPTPLSPDTISVKPSDKPVADGNVSSYPAYGVNPDETLKPAGTEKSKKSSGMSENLTWQTGLYGNIGQVVQKGRDPNIFYGGMATGGLWNKKLNGGLETGLGYEVYNDYGSVTDNIRLTDSIPSDTLGNLQYDDTTRITSYKYRYQYLQVPLFISKQVLSNGKFSLDIKTGPLIGIMISERKTIDYTSGPDGGEILGTVNNDYSRLKISWQWQVMAQLRWNFNERLSLSLSPYGIFYLNNLYDSKSRPANTPFGIGIYGGLIYKFK